MNALVSPISATHMISSALRYELARLRGVRALRAVVLTALATSALLTLPAARQLIGPGHPLTSQPHAARIGSIASQAQFGHALNHASGLALQYTPTPGDGAWVVAGGVAGMALPGIAAALGAAWLGAASIGYEYRHGSGLLTFALVPRRSSVLISKTIVAAAFGALLSLGTTATAYATARLGFRLAGTQVALPTTLLAPGLREAAMAALGGALGVLAGALLRVRVLATLTALAGCALVAAYLPQSSSLVVPYLVEAVRFIVRAVPAVTYASASALLLAVPLVTLALAALLTIHRRRIA